MPPPAPGPAPTAPGQAPGLQHAYGSGALGGIGDERLGDSRGLTWAGLCLRAQVTAMASSSARPEDTSPPLAAFVRLVRASSAVTRELSAQLSADHDLT